MGVLELEGRLSSVLLEGLLRFVIIRVDLMRFVTVLGLATFVTFVT